MNNNIAKARVNERKSSYVEDVSPECRELLVQAAFRRVIRTNKKALKLLADR